MYLNSNLLFQETCVFNESEKEGGQKIRKRKRNSFPKEAISLKFGTNS